MRQGHRSLPKTSRREETERLLLPVNAMTSMTMTTQSSASRRGGASLPFQPFYNNYCPSVS
jgi:hypothetical protein